MNYDMTKGRNDETTKHPNDTSTRRLASRWVVSSFRRFVTIALFALVALPLFAQEKTIMVRTGHPERKTIAQSIKKTGSLTAPSTVDICAKIAGRLESLALADGTPVKAGLHVKKGQIIGTLESRDYAAQLDFAKANLQAAEATLLDKTREMERAKLLRDQGVSTEREHDLAVADCERARAAFAQAKAQVDLAQINFDETRLAAPMDGVISAEFADPGALLMAGTRVVTLTQVDALRFQIDVPTTLFAQLSLDTGISIEVDAYPGELIETTLFRIYPTAQSDTRTVRVEAQIANPNMKYVPGMYALGTLALNRRDNALTVPFETVVRNIDKNFVYTVVDGVAKATIVKVGIRSDADVEIVEGLSDTDTIVTVGQHRLADGIAVKTEEK